MNIAIQASLVLAAALVAAFAIEGLRMLAAALWDRSERRHGASAFRRQLGRAWDLLMGDD